MASGMSLRGPAFQIQGDGFARLGGTHLAWWPVLSATAQWWNKFCGRHLPRRQTKQSDATICKPGFSLKPRASNSVLAVAREQRSPGQKVGIPLLVPINLLAMPDLICKCFCIRAVFFHGGTYHQSTVVEVAVLLLVLLVLLLPLLLLIARLGDLDGSLAWVSYLKIHETDARCDRRKHSCRDMVHMY